MRIGVVGLGSIAQKAWLPVLGAAESWTLQAAWSPGKEKALRICETWRMPYADSLDALAAQCDAVFVHTSTASHYEVVNHLLNAGVHVCVDKPLADKLSEAETLVELAARRRLTLMVGFNRRFAPLVETLRTQLAGRTRPLAMIYTCNAGAIPAEHWTQYPAVGGGRILGEACHFVDLLHYLADE